MTPRRKRRWLLAAFAVAVVAVGIALAFSPEDLQNDAPQLVILRQEHTNGQRVVVFRFDALKHRRAVLQKLSTQNLSTGEESPAGLVQGVGESLPGAHEEHTVQGTAFFLSHHLETRAGQSKEFWVIAPAGDVWRLQSNVAFEDRRIRTMLGRVKRCWETRSFAPVRWPVWLSVERFESEPITNAAPKAADAPRP